MPEQNTSPLLDREANLIRSMLEVTWKFYVWVGCLLAVALWGLFAYSLQLRRGLIVTGLGDQISWGLYITNFVFFIGISHAGTLISAILRVSHARWRKPITRLAEGITVFAICIGAPMVIIDLGRPDRMLNLFRHGRIQSPILWDVISVSTYLTGCLLYFYIPMIPDLALLAEHSELPIWRRRLYKFLSNGWVGSTDQWHLLEKSISVMAIFIIPLAISVHTVVSWIFAMTLRPGWNTSIFGPYFVTGAIYSGIGAVIISMYFLRRIFRLEDYIEELHFRNLGLLLLVMSLLFLYFNVNEYMTVGYKLPGMERILLDSLFEGNFAPYFKLMLGLTTVGPTLLLIAVLGIKRWHHFVIPGTVVAASFVVVGAWLERYLIVVPTLSNPFLTPSGLSPATMHYRPTWVEWSITAAAFATFLLIYTFLSKLFPMVSMWETSESNAAFTAKHRVVAKKGRPVPVIPPEPSPSMPSVFGMVLLAAILGSAASARAEQAPVKKALKPAAMTLKWEDQGAGLAAPPAREPETGWASHFYSGVKGLFAPLLFTPEEDASEKGKASPTVKVTATLLDDKGSPLPYQAVGFGLETSFGTILQFGKVPTNGEGKATLVLHDRRCGVYPFQAVWGGDETFQPAYANANVDFGACPAPGLPAVGVLITPYATAPITLAFAFFYGTMWVAFIYAFGYLLLWRMRRLGKETT